MKTLDYMLQNKIRSLEKLFMMELQKTIAKPSTFIRFNIPVLRINIHTVYDMDVQPHN